MAWSCLTGGELTLYLKHNNASLSHVTITDLGQVISLCFVLADPFVDNLNH